MFPISILYFAAAVALVAVAVFAKQSALLVFASIVFLVAMLAFEAHIRRTEA